MIGAKLKIALLYDLWNEDPAAAAAKEEAETARKPARKSRRSRKRRPIVRKFSKRSRNSDMSLRTLSWMVVRRPCIRFRVAMPTSSST